MKYDWNDQILEAGTLVVNAMIGSDDVLHYLWLYEKFNELVMKMAHLVANVSAINVFKYLP